MTVHSVSVEDRRVVIKRGHEVVANLTFSEVCMAASMLREYAESVTPVDPVPALRALDAKEDRAAFSRVLANSERKVT